MKVGVRGICDGRFYESRARVQEEGQRSVYGEPEARTGETGDGDCPVSAGGAESDRTVRLQGLLGGRRGVGVIRSLAVGLEEEDLVAIVDGRPGNVGIDGAGGCLVLQCNGESRVRHDEFVMREFDQNMLLELRYIQHWRWSISRRRQSLSVGPYIKSPKYVQLRKLSIENLRVKQGRIHLER